MNPGRELDALIAEKVMGWDQSEMYGINNYREDGSPVMMPNFPLYSDDVAAAWEVVEEMKTKGYAFALTSGIAPGYDVVTFASPVKGMSCVDRAGGSTSVPHGICLAALKAVGCDTLTG